MRPLREIIDGMHRLEHAWLGTTPADLEWSSMLRRVKPDPLDAWCHVCGSSLPGAGCECWCEQRSCDAVSTFNRICRLARYDRFMSTLLKQFKYDGHWIIGRVLGRLLGRQLTCMIPNLRPGAVVVPIPSPWIRLVSSRLDHASLIARSLCGELSLCMHRPIRQVAGPRQVGLDRSSRMTRGDRFRPGWLRSSREQIRRKQVILVDDVRTTGKTLDQASATLHALGACEVIAAVVAVADQREAYI